MSHMQPNVKAQPHATMATHHPPNAYLALRGGSLDYFSPYATTASLARQSPVCSARWPNKPRPPATPWMGEGQSRADRMSSSFQSATGLHTIAGPFEGASSAKLAFGRPVTASTHEIDGMSPVFLPHSRETPARIDLGAA